MCVADGHGNGLVAGEFLYSAEIDSLHHQPTDERVAKIVPMKILDLGLFHGEFEPFA